MKLTPEAKRYVTWASELAGVNLFFMALMIGVTGHARSTNHKDIYIFKTWDRSQSAWQAMAVDLSTFQVTPLSDESPFTQSIPENFVNHKMFPFPEQPDSFKWSSDGNWVAFTYADENYDNANLFLRSRDGKEVKQITHLSPDTFISDFAWTKDGQHLIYIELYPRSNARVFIFEVTTSLARLVTDQSESTEIKIATLK